MRTLPNILGKNYGISAIRQAQMLASSKKAVVRANIVNITDRRRKLQATVCDRVSARESRGSTRESPV